MADRRGDIELLLATRFDHLWLPTGSLRTQPGLAPADRRPCETCGGAEIRDDFDKVILRRRGKGVIVDRFRKRTTCPTCRGDGWTARDRMDSRRTVLGSDQTSSSARPRRTVTCDACDGHGTRGERQCSYCGGAGERDLHVFELHLDNGELDADRDPVAEAIFRRDTAGSYHELDQALDGIVHHVNKPEAFRALNGRNAVQARRLLDLVYLPPRDVELHEVSPLGRLLIALAFGYIDQRMPDPIRVPGDVRANAGMQREQLRRARGRNADAKARGERDRQAREWVREERPVTWICAELGITDRQLRRIVNGDEAAA